MKTLRSCFVPLAIALITGLVAPSAPVFSATPTAADSLVTLAQRIRPDFLLGSMAGGLDPAAEKSRPLADFFVRNFNIMTVGVYMSGLQLHTRLKNGTLHGWANNQPFDLDAFSAQLQRYAQAGIDVHITEFDIHLGPDPTPEDFALQGKYYAEILRRVLQAPAVKSFKTWGVTDRHSWKADGKDGRPLLLDENLQPKPAYLRQVEMLRALAAP